MSNQDIEPGESGDDLKDTPLDMYIHARLSGDDFAPVPELDVERGVSQLMAAIQIEKFPNIVSQTRARSSWKAWAGFSAMATFVIVLLSVAIPSKAPEELKTYSTVAGQRARITLPSGVQITLAPASKLTVTENSASLEGQGVFTVLHKNSEPFTVKSGSVTVRVLGTTFSVRSYTGERSSQVVVAEGKVSANDVVLSGGDVATITDSRVTMRSGVDVAAALSWTSGRLSFNETPLRDVIPDLNRWYNVDIKLSDPSLGRLPVTGAFPEGAPGTLPEILELILNARSVAHGRVITIYPR